MVDSVDNINMLSNFPYYDYFGFGALKFFKTVKYLARLGFQEIELIGTNIELTTQEIEMYKNKL